jgi:hypothetical protein
MPQFIVRHDFTKCQPANWHRSDYVRIFGDRNQGFAVTADSLDAARAAIESGAAEIRRFDGAPLRRGLNPFYLTIVER